MCCAFLYIYIWTGHSLAWKFEPGKKYLIKCITTVVQQGHDISRGMAVNFWKWTSRPFGGVTSFSSWAYRRISSVQDTQARSEQLELVITLSEERNYLFFSVPLVAQYWMMAGACFVGEGNWLCCFSGKILHGAEPGADRQPLCSWGSILGSEGDVLDKHILSIKIWKF